MDFIIPFRENKKLSHHANFLLGGPNFTPSPHICAEFNIKPSGKAIYVVFIISFY